MIEVPTNPMLIASAETVQKNDLLTVFNDQVIEFDNIKFNKLDCFSVNRNLTLDEEVSFKKFVYDVLDENTNLRPNQTLENYPKVCVGDGVYNPKNITNKEL